MARYTPNGIASAMRSLRLNSTLSSRPSFPVFRQTIRRYATEIETETPSAQPEIPVPVQQLEQQPEQQQEQQQEQKQEQKPQIPTQQKEQLPPTPPPSEVTAAPKINFDLFRLQPARIIPASPSYFSGNPRFIDHVLRLEAMQAKYAGLPTVTAGDAPRMAWFKLAQFRDFVGEAVPVKKYKSLVKILQQLNRIEPNIVPTEVRSALKDFLRPGNPYAAQSAPRVVDENGRARAKGKRKESTAVVHLVEGEGEVLVNGKGMVEVFQRVHDRESALWALRSTQRLDKYNVWATVSGGGVTGQAEAITLAIARALLIHEPGLKPVLRKAGVITVDARRVERKKPGHVKARKMPTWVKR
ncbi:37S ribosomal protein S9 [Penicillium verhagenii]|nr:37S ribosomal protein S9 [Penicillium verhagenii]